MWEDTNLIQITHYCRTDELSLFLKVMCARVRSCVSLYICISEAERGHCIPSALKCASLMCTTL